MRVRFSFLTVYFVNVFSFHFHFLCCAAQKIVRDAHTPTAILAYFDVFFFSVFLIRYGRNDEIVAQTPQIYTKQQTNIPIYCTILLSEQRKQQFNTQQQQNIVE